MKRLNYIGCKHSLIDYVCDTINEKVGIEGKKILDGFSGTGVVGYNLMERGANVIANDLEYYSFVIGKGLLCGTYNERVKMVINDMNELEGEDGLVVKHYTENGEENRKFFTIKNGRLIDGVRQYLDEIRDILEEEDYYFLLGSILVSADKVANTASVYGAYLKNYKKSALKRFVVEPLHMGEECRENEVYNKDISELVGEIGKIDVVYLDPPYNERQYGKNYHVLNYVAHYDGDMEVYGVTGLIRNIELSRWCRKREAEGELDRLLGGLVGKCEWVFMSYNNEGIILMEKIREIMERYCEVELVEREYGRFKSNKEEENRSVIEYLWIGKFT